MLKIDIHTHILPENLNQITETFSDPRYLKLYSINNISANLVKEGEIFRKVDCNCWNIKERIIDCNKTNINIQVLSTVPVLFSYWGDDYECLILSKFLNDHISSICKKQPERFLGLGTIPMQNTEFAIKEMDRCKNDLNLSGIQIGSNINGENLSIFFDHSGTRPHSHNSSALPLV